MSYPTPQITFISYREKSTASGVMRANTIYCCSEHSEYDPFAGAKVVGGPAPQPLAAILLEQTEQKPAQTAATEGCPMAGEHGNRTERRAEMQKRMQEMHARMGSHEGRGCGTQNQHQH
jgi:hypothetical protein